MAKGDVTSVNLTGTPEVGLPNYRRPELVQATYELTLIQDLLGGTRKMQAKVTTYIRKWTHEKVEVYNIRSVAEQVFEGLGRILSASVGMLFAQPPVIEWNDASEEFQAEWEDIDGAGTSGKVFVKRMSEGAVRDGVGAILVDHTPAPEDADGNPIEVNAQMEDDMGLRPIWASYPRLNVLSWFTEKVGGKSKLTSAVLLEPTTIRSGMFGVKTVQRYRALALVPMEEGMVAVWILYEALTENPGGMEDFKVVDEGVFRNKNGEPAPFIPLSLAHTGRSDAPLTSTIPLSGVAYANLGHWQLSTNLRYYIDLLSFPQPYIIGELAPEMRPGEDGNLTAQPGKLKLGPGVFVHLMGEGAEYGYASPSPENYEPIQARIVKKEEDMAAMSMSFLARDKRAAETAEAKRMDSTAENATLATAAQGIDDCVNRAYEYHQWYKGEDGEAPTFTINRDFENMTMAPAVMAVYVSAVDKAGLPPRILLQAWQEGGRIAEDVDLEELEREIMANIAAKEQAEREAEELAAKKLEAEPEGAAA